MPLITIPEILDILLMSVIIGYIFSDVFRKPMDYNDPLSYYQSNFQWNNILYAAMITAPAVILHELAHKFIALSFGMQATFQAAYFFLGLGVLLKLMRFGFIFFVPAYVSIIGTGTSLQFSLIAFAGPLMNLILWLSTAFILKQNLVNKKYVHALALTSKINMFLFIFNILPIPGFDGFKVFAGMLGLF
jgi:Zn-dependent protease